MSLPQCRLEVLELWDSCVCDALHQKSINHSFAVLGVRNTAPFWHQQNHSVVLPNLLFGHNYRGFVEAIEWEPSEWKKTGAEPPE